MKKIILIAAALSLAACGPGGGIQSAGTTATTTAPTTSITPLGNTRVDDEAIVFAYRALSTAAKSIDALIVAKVITPGSPRAVALANGLEGTLTWLDRASALQKAGQAANAWAAWQQAKAGLANLDLGLGK